MRRSECFVLIFTSVDGADSSDSNPAAPYIFNLSMTVNKHQYFFITSSGRIKTSLES